VKRSGLLIGGVLICSIGTANANGRFPEAQQIESVPGDPSTLYLRATFGVLVSHDAGKHWRWICERALGYEGQWDPPIAVTRDGRLWVGLEDGLVATREGCDVEAVPELDGQTVKDLTIDAEGDVVWAITGAPGKDSFVWRRPRAPDGGAAKFERLAMLRDTNLMTIEVAPSNGSRVYLSGQPYSTIRGQLFRSSDGGKSFTTSKNELPAEGPFFIAAIDPKDADRVLVRHLHGKGSDLLLTRDAGKTFTNVLSMKSAMFGFAKHAGTYWAGSGLANDGLFRSTDRGESFENVAKRGVLCLHAAGPEALFACENALAPGAPAVAVSPDRGQTLRPLARFADIQGPAVCPNAKARVNLCEASWPETKALFATSPSDAGGVDAGRAPAPAPPPPRSSCGCDVVGQATSPGPLAWVLVGVLATLRRRATSLTLEPRGSNGRSRRPRESSDRSCTCCP
jgi:MYXO-CTERM domain-containing protein